MVKTPVSRSSIRNTGIALIIVASIAAGFRLYLAIIHHKSIRVEDAWLASCYVFFLVLAILYLYIVPAFFRLTDLGEGVIEPYATANDDALFIQKGLFTVSACLWFCLWSAKFSLLWIYKKLLVQLPFYMRLWYALVGFCVLTLIGNIVTLFLACSSMEAWFAVGKCTTPRDVRAAAISMWFAYATDVLTDLLIMLLPLRLIVTLQMPLSRKCSIAALFGLGWICITASTVRVTQIGQPGGQPTVPWLALWGTIEATIAVIIVTGPGLYRLAKLQSRSRRAYYAENSRTKTSQNKSHSRGAKGGQIELHSYPAAHTSVSTGNANSSQEGLVIPQRYDITVTKEVSVDTETSRV
ncbi:hypothetical protein H9Q72_000611 [Fusarium xylarioides]|uniref:Rhodopsin domain-containing protein n=1 Tax=Fusarium xylarioides TaxID=221167 RepID=A0A9P7I3D2_9HYPO|nr:hypothetical protein H9Q72_000611 [Fusarium xylarioides]